MHKLQLERLMRKYDKNRYSFLNENPRITLLKEFLQTPAVRSLDPHHRISFESFKAFINQKRIAQPQVLSAEQLFAHEYMTGNSKSADIFRAFIKGIPPEFNALHKKAIAGKLTEQDLIEHGVPLTITSDNGAISISTLLHINYRRRDNLIYLEEDAFYLMLYCSNMKPDTPEQHLLNDMLKFPALVTNTHLKDLYACIDIHLGLLKDDGSIRNVRNNIFVATKQETDAYIKIFTSLHSRQLLTNQLYEELTQRVSRDRVIPMSYCIGQFAKYHNGLNMQILQHLFRVNNTALTQLSYCIASIIKNPAVLYNRPTILESLLNLVTHPPLENGLVNLANNSPLENVDVMLRFLNDGSENLLANNWDRVLELRSLINTRMCNAVDRIPNFMITQETVDQIFTYLRVPNGYALIREFCHAITDFRDDRAFVRHADAAAHFALFPRQPLHDNHFAEQAPQPAAAINPINDGQSTHTTSVHRTASESAVRLNDHYGNQSNEEMNAIILEIQQWASTLGDTLREKAAKRGITKITAPNYLHLDQRSNVSTRQLVVLIWIAMHDETRRLGTLLNALNRFTDAFVEAIREYNLDANGTDLGGARDREMCAGGTFNKFIEKMVGVLRDAILIFMTKATAAARFPNLVTEEAIKHLATLPRDAAFAELIANLKTGDEGICLIWDQIKEAVTTRFREEYASVYVGEENELCATIAAGEYTKLAARKLDALIAVPTTLAKCITDLSEGEFARLIIILEQNNGQVTTIWQDISAKLTDLLWAEFKKDFANLEDFAFVVNSCSTIKLDVASLQQAHLLNPRAVQTEQPAIVDEKEKMRAARIRMFDKKDEAKLDSTQSTSQTPFQGRNNC